VDGRGGTVSDDDLLVAHGNDEPLSGPQRDRLVRQGAAHRHGPRLQDDLEAFFRVLPFRGESRSFDCDEEGADVEHPVRSTPRDDFDFCFPGHGDARAVLIDGSHLPVRPGKEDDLGSIGEPQSRLRRAVAFDDTAAADLAAVDRIGQAAQVMEVKPAASEEREGQSRQNCSQTKKEMFARWVRGASRN
jgi:hypothetical protein